MSQHRIANLIPAERVLLNTDCESKKRIFEQVSILLENIDGLTRDDVFSKLIERERLGSTAIGNKGAIPHARIKKLQMPVCAFVRLKTPIQYDSQDDDNSLVQTLFFFIVPEKATSRHLSLLAFFSSMLQDDELMEKLAICPDGNAAHQAFIEWEDANQNSINAVFSEEE